jgi:calcineurin-like phosphoesterase family protein
VAVFFTSDHHFGDARRLGIDRRPFASVLAMDDAMETRWNEAVGPDDTVWHLGDLTRSRDADAIGARLARLHGAKHLLVGNNDGRAALAAEGWASIQHYAEIEEDGRRLVLCHYPFRTWNGMGRGTVNLHGIATAGSNPRPANTMSESTPEPSARCGCRTSWPAAPAPAPAARFLRPAHPDAI